MHMKDSNDNSCKKDISFKVKHANSNWHKSMSYYDPSELKKFNANIIAKVRSMSENQNSHELKLSPKLSISDFILKEII